MPSEQEFNEMSEQLKRNPETALDLIQEFLEEQGVKRGTIKDPTSHEIPDSGDNLYYITITSVRIDTHIIRGDSVTEVIKKATSRSEGDDTSKFTRRIETVNPTVFAVPRIAPGQSLDTLQMMEGAVRAKVPKSTELNYTEKPAKRTPSPRRNRMMDDLSDMLNKQAEELD